MLNNEFNNTHRIYFNTSISNLYVRFVCFYSLPEGPQAKPAKKNNADILSKHLIKRQAEFQESIRVIASAILQNQVSLTEGAIRINKLSGLLEDTLSDDIAYEVFSELTEATAHIPILENWAKLTKKEQAFF